MINPRNSHSVMEMFISKVARLRSNKRGISKAWQEVDIPDALVNWV